MGVRSMLQDCWFCQNRTSYSRERKIHQNILSIQKEQKKEQHQARQLEHLPLCFFYFSLVFQLGQKDHRQTEDLVEPILIPAMVRSSA